MVQVFDDWRDDGERVVHKDISGPSSDGYVERGGRVYEADSRLKPTQQKALQADLDVMTDRNRC